ncbi:MAG: hypothetical protein U0228_33165 [Myxococcaceae bacterium]
MRALVVAVLVVSACGRTALVEVSSDGGTSTGGAVCDALIVSDPDTELRERWNRAVDSVQPLTRNFTWSKPNDFPLPTWRGGDTTAYAEFSAALVAFWRAGNNVDFVRCNELFEKSYLSGPAVQTQKSVQLRPLTKQMSVDSLVPTSRQGDLQAICLTISC